MEIREEILRMWFAMWLQKKDLGIQKIFVEDAVYIESWGPMYQGREKICHWFQEWNTRGSVLQWDIRQFFHREEETMVLWYFKNQMQNGRIEAFDGVTYVKWSPKHQIVFLQEFGCNTDRYDPYAQGPVPVFREAPALWF